MNPGSLCQIEIPVRDLQCAIQFYQQAFGWQATPAEMHHYAVLDVPEGCPYGISLLQIDTTAPLSPPVTEPYEGPNRVALYFATDNPEDTVRRAEAAGGKKRFGPRALPGYGTIWQVSDPDGNRWGLFQKP